MRLRTIGTFTSWPEDYVSGVENASCSALGWTEEVRNSLGIPKIGKVKTFEDVVTPGFFRERRKGKVFFNPMRMTERIITFSGSGGVAREKNKLTCSGTTYDRIRRWTSNHHAFTLTQAPYYGINPDDLTLMAPRHSEISSEDVDQAILEVATRARSGVAAGSAGGWESAAEFNQALKLIDKPFESIKTLASHFRGQARRRKGSQRIGRAGTDILQVTANEWLKFRYGVLPLMSDIQAVLRELGGKYGVVRRSSRASATLRKVSTTTFSTTAGGGWSCTQFQRRESEATIRAVSLDEYRTSMAVELGFHHSQLPSTAWDLIPYSFVVDWFINVGDYLNAITPRLDVNHLGGCVTVEDTTVTTVTPIAANPPSTHVTVTPLTGTYQESVRTKTRSVALPAPGLVVKQDFRFDRLTRLGDALSLIGQQLLRISVR